VNVMTNEEQFIYSRISRRGFMGATAGATLSALVGREPRLEFKQARNPKAPAADAVIVLWMAGGMAQTETFDPKRYTPFAPGVRVENVLSTFPGIDTAVDNIKFTQGLEQIASVIDRGTVIRTFNAADLGFILHSRHQYHWHTGYIPPQPMAMPHLGAVISKTLGPRNPDMPAFIAIGQTVEGPERSARSRPFTPRAFSALSTARSSSSIRRTPPPRCVRRRSSARRASAAAASCSRSCWRRSRCISTVETSSANRW